MSEEKTAVLAARTREELVAALEAGREGAGAALAEPGAVKWLFFWGHTPKEGDAIGSWVLSQWWPCSFSVDGVDYASAEHWMMAEKARLFGDDETLAAIIAAATPAEAKKLGRLVRGFDDARWEAAGFDAVVRGNVHKFGQDPELRRYLLGTANRVLVEASPRDRIWGIGLGAGNERATDPRAWRGRNLLGFALMEARSRLATAGAAA
ncbi:MAG TPA: NADAR family protein [Actinospica sp.]|nr:NADAR family protein [Actinospica sp.]